MSLYWNKSYNRIVVANKEFNKSRIRALGFKTPNDCSRDSRLAIFKFLELSVIEHSLLLPKEFTD